MLQRIPRTSAATAATRTVSKDGAANWRQEIVLPSFLRSLSIFRRRRRRIAHEKSGRASDKTAAAVKVTPSDGGERGNLFHFHPSLSPSVASVRPSDAPSLAIYSATAAAAAASTEIERRSEGGEGG